MTPHTTLGAHLDDVIAVRAAALIAARKLAEAARTAVAEPNRHMLNRLAEACAQCDAAQDALEASERSILDI